MATLHGASRYRTNFFDCALNDLPEYAQLAVEGRAQNTYDGRMTANAQKVLEDALTLPPNDRAQLAAELLASLDETEADVEAAWAVEIKRRAAEARQNPDDDEDWRVVLDEIQREVLSR